MHIKNNLGVIRTTKKKIPEIPEDTEIKEGKQIAEGKTKGILAILYYTFLVLIRSKKSLTKGDGAQSLELEGKDEWATSTACNVFALLNFMGVPTHFIRQKDKTTFLAFKLKMFPIEIVIRRIAEGSYLDRNPGIERGAKLNYVIEIFLKDDLLHDPIMIWNGMWWDLYDAHKPILPENLIKPLPKDTYFMPTQDQLKVIYKIARTTFIVLEKAFGMLGVVLADLKIECGLDEFGEIRLGDVVDNDSWRIKLGGVEMSKQAYRDALTITAQVVDSLKDKFKTVAELTGLFKDIMVELKEKLTEEGLLAEPEELE